MLILTEAEVKNFKGIHGTIYFKIADGVFYIVGVNGSGKTSLLDAIWFAITGKTPNVHKKDRWQLKRGSKPANVSVTLHDTEQGIDITIKRRFTKTKHEVSVTTSDGSLINAKDIEDLIKEHTYNVNSFLGMSTKEQAEALGIESSVFDKRIIEAKEVLSDANKDKLKADARLKDISDSEVEKVKRINVSSISAQMADAQAGKAHLNRLEDKIKQNDTLVEQYKSNIETLLRKVDQLEKVSTSLNAQIEDYPKLEDDLDESIQKCQKSLQNANETNKKAELYERYKRARSEAADCRQHWENARKTLSITKQVRVQFLQNAGLPEMAKLDDEGRLLVLRDDGEFSPLNSSFFNTAALLEKAILLLLECQSMSAPIFLITGGGLLDRGPDGQVTILKTLHEKTGAQILCELVSAEKPKGAESILLTEVNTEGDE